MAAPQSNPVPDIPHSRLLELAFTLPCQSPEPNDAVDVLQSEVSGLATYAELRVESFQCNLVGHDDS